MQSDEHPRHRCQCTALLLAAALLVLFLLIPLVNADETGLTRGSRFTITITGTPNTSYYVWLTRTYTMSGQPGDQPPIFVANQANIEKDPSGGPYVIGSYQINNEGGRTIIDDVAPSTASMSNTQYYALVTTDKDGKAIVAFQTSSSTATRTFSVKVENAQSAAKDNILVQQGDVAVKRGSVGFDTVATLPGYTTVPTMVIPLTTETSPPLPTTTVPIPSPTVTPIRHVQVGMGVCIVAVGVVILAGRKSA